MSMWYDMQRCSANSAVLVVFRRSRRLPLAPRDAALESRGSALVTFLSSTFTSRQLRASNFFTAEEVKVLRKMVCFRRAH